MIKNIITNSSKETKKFAREFAKDLKGGEVLALVGELGAGKTTFVQGLTEGLGIKDKIQSPTFVILKEYSIKNSKSEIKNFIHIDCYRLKSVKDALSVGISDYLGHPSTVTVIEWASQIEKILPKNTIWIKFEHVSENKRKISVMEKK